MPSLRLGGGRAGEGLFLRQPTRQVVDKLLRDGRARLKDCKSQHTGKTYNASVLMTTEADGRAKFSLEFENGGVR